MLFKGLLLGLVISVSIGGVVASCSSNTLNASTATEAHLNH